MTSLDDWACLALLLSSVFSVANTIRPLKEGPVIGPDGRQYKSAPLSVDAPVGGVSISGSPTVRVECTESLMIVKIKADLYNNGRLVRPEELSLGQATKSGNTYCQAFALSDTDYVIEVGLHDCGSKLTIVDDLMVYSNKLFYSPLRTGHHSITRTTAAVVPVSCHYKRTHFVSSSASQQYPGVSILVKNSPGHTGFSLRLMTDDWRNESPSNVQYLDDPLRLEASYMDSNYLTRRLFIDHCVATLEPDVASMPRYYFIENHGCLVDAKDEDSNSHFRPQEKVNVIQLHLDAFLFQQDPRNSIFITCQLTATEKQSSPFNKACNYTNSRWSSVAGKDDVCQCCDTICNEGSPKKNHKTSLGHLVSKDTMIHGTASLGPVMIVPQK